MEGYKLPHDGNQSGTDCLIELTIEVHLIKDFSHGLLLGMDTIQDYSINFILSAGIATIGNLSYAVISKGKFRTVLIRSKRDITIVGRTCMKIPISSQMAKGMDYTFTLWQFQQGGQPIGPSLSLPFCIIDSSV